MKRKRFWAVIVLLAGAVIFIYAIKEQRICRFVKKNAAELEEIALACLGGDDTVKSYRGVKVEGLYEGGHDIVEFGCGGFGIAPSSAYYGFYYSPDDVPVATAYFMNCDGYSLVSGGEDAWTWEEDGGDNGCRVRRIAPHWYYYKAWF